MGVGCAQSEVADESAEAGFEISSFKENGEHQTPIKFGSHGLDEPVKGESKVSELKFPKDAAEEWPEPKQIHSFWFVKYRSFNDQNLRAKFEQADKELQKQNDSRSHLIEKLREKKSERAKIISELKALGAEEKEHWSKIEEKKKEIEPLKKVFGQLRGAGLANRDGKAGLCSSEEELNNVIKSLQYRIQHESIPLSEEKQILRNIKLLESTREKVVENAATRGKNQESMGEKEALQGQVKLIGVGLDDVRKNHRLIKAKIEQLDDIKKAIDKEIKSIDEELIEATRKRAKTFENIQELKNQREEGNLPFYENRSLLIKAKELAAKKDVESLRDLCENEVSKFLSLWSSNKTFREDYEKRILSSLDARQLSRDGRIRIPGERPILSIEASTPAESEVVAKGSVEQPKELSSSRSQAEASLAEKDEEEKILMQANEANNKKKETIKRPADAEEEDEYFIPEKLQKDPLKVNEVDKQKLKEMRREEEMAKAKQALERKKKMAEKAAAKAAIKAQKEAEKKEKEREKRLKKKTGPSVAAQETEEQSEASAKVVDEAEKVEEVVEAPVPEKNMDRKMAVRSRNRPKGLNSLPKTLIKRKKPKNYWMLGAAVAAAVAVFLLAIVGYRFLV